MSTSVMYIGYQPYFLDLANEMDKYGWKPVYWSVTDRTRDVVLDRYPGSVCHDHFDAIKGLRPPRYLDTFVPETCPLTLKTLSKYESNVMRMFERNDSHHENSFGYRARYKLYKYFVAYWTMVFEDLKPDYIVFEEEPHEVSDYVLYMLAPLFEIETILFVRTKFRTTFYPVNRFEEGSRLIKQNYTEALKDDPISWKPLSKEMNSYFNSISGTYEDAVNVHLFDQVSEVKSIYDKGNGSLNKYIFTMWTTITRLFRKRDMIARWKLLRSSPGYSFNSDQKEKKKEFSESQMSYLKHIFYKGRSLLKKRKMRSYYNKSASKMYDLSSKPYILCTLHYQPEKTTCPLGGEFDDQLYMIRILAELIPDDWVLFVKDHPSQFVSSYTRYGEAYRSKQFYDEIMEVDKVILVPLDSDVFELLDNAKAVATVTGTTAWESLVRGVPALLFGYSWFVHCRGVFFVDSKDSLRGAIDRIQHGYKVNLDEIKLFSSVVEENSFKGMVGGPGLSDFFDISAGDNGKEHARAVRSLIDHQ